MSTTSSYSLAKPDCTLARLVKLLAAENELHTCTASHVTWLRGTRIYGKGQNLFRRLAKPVSYKQNCHGNFGPAKILVLGPIF